jgi:hypothetical protein
VPGQADVPQEVFVQPRKVATASGDAAETAQRAEKPEGLRARDQSAAML